MAASSTTIESRDHHWPSPMDDAVDEPERRISRKPPPREQRDARRLVGRDDHVELDTTETWSRRWIKSTASGRSMCAYCYALFVDRMPKAA